MKEITHIGQSVYRIEVNILEDLTKPSIYKEGIIIEPLKIVHQTSKKIALSDDYITTLDIPENGKKEPCSMYLNEIYIRIESDEAYWSNGLFCKVYSLDNSGATIDKILLDIAKKVKAKYGFLYNGIGEKLNKLKIEIL